MKMQEKLLQDDRAVCMLVEVIAKKSQNVKWTTTVDGKVFSHDRIRRISIDKFYEIVFGDSEAFFKLCRALPDILDDAIAELQCGSIENNVYEELNQLSPDMSKSLYLLAFKTYDGFQNL